MSIRLNVCGNDEVLGISADQGDRLDFMDMMDAAETESCVCRLVADWNYWNGGPGYGKGLVAVEILGYGTVSNQQQAAVAAAWLARNGKDYPSRVEIETAFSKAEKMAEEIAKEIREMVRSITDGENG
jgi:hypothetical protein